MLTDIKSLLLALSLFVPLFITGCGDDTPLEPKPVIPVIPVVTEEHLRFFPLSPDFVAEYEYISQTDPRSYNPSPLEKWTALLRIEVIDSWIEGLTAGYKIRKTLLHPVEGYEGELADLSAGEIDHNLTIEEEFNILYQDSTLWYVDEAPSFEKLAEGTLTVFFEDPANGRGEINLRMYSYSGVYSLDLERMDRFFLERVINDEHGYTVNRYEFHVRGGWGLFGEVVVREFLGITSVDSPDYCCSTSPRWTHDRKIELIQRD
ncbi:MAG: hypothetical protein FVQ81_16500 [Candidatus Glassbacteria bacterium]|nr:hypothetical protein [Candidatus Glassbacteria bacterium]